MHQFSNLTSRILVAVIAMPFIVWLTMLGGYFFFGLVALISAVALYEFYGMAEAKGAAPLKTFGIIAGFCVNAVFIYERTQVEVYQFFLDHGMRLSMFSQHQLFSVVLLVFVLLVLLIELFRTQGSPTMNIATTVLGVLVISFCLGTLIFLRELFPYGFPVYKFFTVGFADDGQLAQINRWGGFTVISILASIWLCDTAAYLAAKLSANTCCLNASARKKLGKDLCADLFLRLSRWLPQNICCLAILHCIRQSFSEFLSASSGKSAI